MKNVGFNPSLEAQMHDRLETIGARVLAWIKRRAWGNCSLYCVRDNGEPAYDSDCVAELRIDRVLIWKTIRYLELRGYVERHGPANLLYPFASPALMAPPDLRAPEYSNFLDYWRGAHSTFNVAEVHVAHGANLPISGKKHPQTRTGGGRL